jgi:hypothetical protein
MKPLEEGDNSNKNNRIRPVVGFICGALIFGFGFYQNSNILMLSQWSFGIGIMVGAFAQVFSDKLAYWFRIFIVIISFLFLVCAVILWVTSLFQWLYNI